MRVVTISCWHAMPALKTLGAAAVDFARRLHWLYPVVKVGNRHQYSRLEGGSSWHGTFTSLTILTFATTILGFTSLFPWHSLSFHYTSTHCSHSQWTTATRNMATNKRLSLELPVLCREASHSFLTSEAAPIMSYSIISFSNERLKKQQVPNNSPTLVH